jgi:ubiquinone/menaquinone biosynthesis C-methylase UbiE
MVGQKVRAFYEECSFPGYEEYDDPFQLTRKARQRVYFKLLDDQIPYGVRILDVGCGTGQLAIFLSMNNRKTVGVDFSMGSLRKGHEFKTRFSLKNVAFLQMDLFALALKEESFDYVFCSGVLHHTADAYQGFRELCRLVKKGGYIVIGLYNRYGRLLLNFRQLLFRLSGDRLTWLDYRVRKCGEGKSRIWYLDQYKNPHEEKFSVDDVLRWFEENGIEYINSVPKVQRGERVRPDDRLFKPHALGTHLERFLCQLRWAFTKGREGGFFITIGRRVE